MTLTHILPTLRQSIPDPLNCDRWPEFTSVTTSDVVIAGVSLVRLAEWCGTPCVHSAAAVIPGTGGRPSDTELASAVVVSVTAVHRRSDGGLTVDLDGELTTVAAETAEARLIGRISTARDVMVHIRAAVLELPGDLREGDLIAVPARGSVRLHDIDPRRRGDVPAGSEPQGYCGR
ncbi:hypothetical protein [Leifsonia sp. NPDC058230]|uniref:hypothetical protein n=1 Tax=Leifsonia sp. NPDC058230 TaxID=3346391 RepID=UPI0036D8D935